MYAAREEQSGRRGRRLSAGLAVGDRRRNPGVDLAGIELHLLRESL